MLFVLLFGPAYLRNRRPAAEAELAAASEAVKALVAYMQQRLIVDELSGKVLLPTLPRPVSTLLQFSFQTSCCHGLMFLLSLSSSVPARRGSPLKRFEKKMKMKTRVAHPNSLFAECVEV